MVLGKSDIMLLIFYLSYFSMYNSIRIENAIWPKKKKNILEISEEITKMFVIKTIRCII